MVQAPNTPKRLNVPNKLVGHDEALSVDMCAPFGRKGVIAPRWLVAPVRNLRTFSQWTDLPRELATISDVSGPERGYMLFWPPKEPQLFRTFGNDMIQLFGNHFRHLSRHWLGSAIAILPIPCSIPGQDSLRPLLSLLSLQLGGCERFRPMPTGFSRKLKPWRAIISLFDSLPGHAKISSPAPTRWIGNHPAPRERTPFLNPFSKQMYQINHGII